MQPTPTNHNESTGIKVLVLTLHYNPLYHAWQFQCLVLRSQVAQDFPWTSAGITLAWAKPWWYHKLPWCLAVSRRFIFLPMASMPDMRARRTSQTFLQEHTQHPWPLYLSVWECCVLHYLLSRKLAIHVHGETGRHLQEHFNILWNCTCLSNATQAGASPPIPFG